jgi:hypothetical protein
VIEPPSFTGASIAILARDRSVIRTQNPAQSITGKELESCRSRLDLVTRLWRFHGSKAATFSLGILVCAMLYAFATFYVRYASAAKDRLRPRKQQESTSRA